MDRQLEMAAEIRTILRRFPVFEQANLHKLQFEPLVGFTNRNYLVSLFGEHYVLRIAAPEEASRLLIDRDAELAALQAAEQAGVGAAVLGMLKPEGHLLTRFLPGRMWSTEEMSDRQVIRRVADALQRVHSDRSTTAEYSPFSVVERYYEIACRAGDLPVDVSSLLRHIEKIQSVTRSNPERLVLCHNDLCRRNFIEDGAVRIIDWEYAGLNDPLFDIATYSASAELPEDLERYLLDCYFGASNSNLFQQLQRMKFVLHVREGLWFTVQLMGDDAYFRKLRFFEEGFDFRQHFRNQVRINFAKAEDLMRRG